MPENGMSNVMTNNHRRMLSRCFDRCNYFLVECRSLVKRISHIKLICYAFIALTVITNCFHKSIVLESLVKFLFRLFEHEIAHTRT